MKVEEVEEVASVDVNGSGLVAVVLPKGDISHSWRNFLPGRHLSSARKRTVVFVIPAGTGWPGVVVGWCGCC